MTVALRENLTEQSIYAPLLAEITEIRSLTAMEKLFTISLPDGIRLDHEPGQFLAISAMGVGEVPISISSSPSRVDRSFELCIRNAGDVTSHFHRMQVGDHVGLRGPFGRGFPVQSFVGKDVLFVLGGLGLAPARSLLNQMLDERGKFGRIAVLLGARTPADLLFTDELQQLSQRTDLDLHVTVDRPDAEWGGNVGVVTTLFPRVQLYARNTIAIVIGPPVMYRFVLMEVLGKGVPEGNIWFSMERRMKCCVGKCGQCQIGPKYACIDGPSLPFTEIRDNPEAL